MTGGEFLPAAAAKAVVSAAKNAVSDEDDKGALQELAADSPNMRSAAESYARRVAVKQAVLLKVYEPLARFLGVSRTYFDTDFHTDMAEKLADIPDEALSTPPPSVAIPAMQGLSYSVDEPDLKDMYLNLLATATDGRVKEDAHPSFADIIKQLSAVEARHLLNVLNTVNLPIVRLSLKQEAGEGRSQLATNVLEFRERETKELLEDRSLPVWVDNWVRLGLVEVDYGRRLVAPGKYEWVEEHPVVVRIVEQDARGRDAVHVDEGLLEPTNFGKRFRAAVSFDGVTIDDPAQT